MVKRNAVWLLIILLLLCSGCLKNNKNVSNNKDNKNIEITSPSSIDDKNNIKYETSNTIDTKVPIVLLQDVWKNKKLLSVDAVMPDKRCWFPLTISMDGDIAGSVPPQNGKYGELIIYNIYSNKYESIASVSEQSQIGTVSINSNWIVWSEALDQSFLKWKIHAYNRFGKNDKVIYSSSTDSTGKGYPGPEPKPKILNNDVVWSSVTGPLTNAGISIKVIKYSLKTGQNTTIVSQGANPCITNDSISWLGKDEKNSKNQRSAIYSNKSEKVEQISDDIAIEDFSTDDNDNIAWIGHNPISSTKWSIGTITDGKNDIILTADNSNPLQFISISSRIIAWSSYYKVQAYDRKLNRIITLQEKDADCSSEFTNNRYFYWTTPAIDDTTKSNEDAKKKGIYETIINIIDLNSI